MKFWRGKAVPAEDLPGKCRGHLYLWKVPGKRGFILELWSSAADLYTVGFVSPGGERISRIPILSNNETRIPFLLDSTVITVSYQLIEAGGNCREP